jgi:hypothetical protein
MAPRCFPFRDYPVFGIRSHTFSGISSQMNAMPGTVAARDFPVKQTRWRAQRRNPGLSTDTGKAMQPIVDYLNIHDIHNPYI